MTDIAELQVRPAGAGELDVLVAALLDADAGRPAPWTAPPEGTGPTWWATVEQADGYCVARCDRGVWRTGRAAVPDLARIDPARILELRVFRADAELCGFPDGDGQLRAVWRLHDPGPVDAELRHLSRDLLLSWGDRRAVEHDGFTVLHRPDGTRTVVPMDRARSATARLRIRQYFIREERSGAVRPALTTVREYVTVRPGEAPARAGGDQP